MQVIWLKKKELIPVAIRAIYPVEVLLDIGCGIVPQNYVLPKVHICCEPFAEYVVYLNKKIAALDACDRSYVVIKMGWSEAVRCFPEKSVDSIFLLDVIEHLEKEEGRVLLAQTEKIAKRQIVIFTPLGFMPQHHPDGKDAWGLNGGNWQEHKSGWLPEDFIGEEWQCFASNEFHTVDNLGNILAPPHGALWAIKTYGRKEKKHHNLLFSWIERKVTGILTKICRKLLF